MILNTKAAITSTKNKQSIQRHSIRGSNSRATNDTIRSSRAANEPALLKNGAPSVGTGCTHTRTHTIAPRSVSTVDYARRFVYVLLSTTCNRVAAARRQYLTRPIKVCALDEERTTTTTTTKTNKQTNKQKTKCLITTMM
jgi:hypothetical protein